MIKIEQLQQPYGFNRISCQLSTGKLVGIMGANGAGKSTLLKTLAGILPITQGEIWLNEQCLSQMNATQKSTQIAYLAQNLRIHWDLTVYDVIALGLPHSFKFSHEKEKISEVAQRFAINHLLEKPFQQLSGGEQARVQLARCCIKTTLLLLADEPIASLDPYYQIDIMQQLKALTPDRTCIVAIHHLALAYRFCDEIILLQKGNLVASGATQSVLTQENLAKAFGISVKFNIEMNEIYGIDKLVVE